MSDLTITEQNHVRTVLRYLRRRIGTWASVASAIQLAPSSINNVMKNGKPVSASLAFRVARFAETPIDDLLSGRSLPGACPKCGHVPDFSDESTNVEIVPRSVPGNGLALVK